MSQQVTKRLGNVRVVKQVTVGCDEVDCPICCHPRILAAAKRAIRMVDKEREIEEKALYARRERARLERMSTPPDTKLPAMMQVIQTRKVR